MGDDDYGRTENNHHQEVGPESFHDDETATMSNAKSLADDRRRKSSNLEFSTTAVPAGTNSTRVELFEGWTSSHRATYGNPTPRQQRQPQQHPRESQQSQQQRPSVWPMIEDHQVQQQQYQQHYQQQQLYQQQQQQQHHHHQQQPIQHAPHTGTNVDTHSALPSPHSNQYDQYFSHDRHAAPITHTTRETLNHNTAKSGTDGTGAVIENTITGSGFPRASADTNTRLGGQQSTEDERTTVGADQEGRILWSASGQVPIGHQSSFLSALHQNVESFGTTSAVGNNNDNNANTNQSGGIDMGHPTTMSTKVEHMDDNNSNMNMNSTITTTTTTNNNNNNNSNNPWSTIERQDVSAKPTSSTATNSTAGTYMTDNATMDRGRTAERKDQHEDDGLSAASTATALTLSPAIAPLHDDLPVQDLAGGNVTALRLPSVAVGTPSTVSTAPSTDDASIDGGMDSSVLDRLAMRDHTLGHAPTQAYVHQRRDVIGRRNQAHAHGHPHARTINDNVTGSSAPSSRLGHHHNLQQQQQQQQQHRRTGSWDTQATPAVSAWSRGQGVSTAIVSQHGKHENVHQGQQRGHAQADHWPGAPSSQGTRVASFRNDQQQQQQQQQQQHHTHGNGHNQHQQGYPPPPVPHTEAWRQHRRTQPPQHDHHGLMGQSNQPHNHPHLHPHQSHPGGPTGRRAGAYGQHGSHGQQHHHHHHHSHSPMTPPRSRGQRVQGQPPNRGNGPISSDPSSRPAHPSASSPSTGPSSSPGSGPSGQNPPRSSSEILKTLLRKKACLYEPDTSRAVALVTWLVGRELALRHGYFSRQQLQSGVHACVSKKIDSGTITRTKVNRCMQIILNSCFHYIIPRPDGSEENGNAFREGFAANTQDDTDLLTALPEPWNDIVVDSDTVHNSHLLEGDHHHPPSNSSGNQTAGTGSTPKFNDKKRTSALSPTASPRLTSADHPHHAAGGDSDHHSKRAVLLCFNENVRSAEDIFRCHNEFIRDTANASRLQLTAQEWRLFFGQDATSAPSAWGTPGKKPPLSLPGGKGRPGSSKAAVTDVLGHMDEKELSKFRCSWCAKRYDHDHELCGFAHVEVNNGWLRRDPQAYNYKPVLCPSVVEVTLPLDAGSTVDPSTSKSNKDGNNGTIRFFINECVKGNDCEFAHSEEEVLYHPDFYKQKPCKNITHGCPFGDVCPYLHPNDAKKYHDGRTPSTSQRHGGRQHGHGHNQNHGHNHGHGHGHGQGHTSLSHGAGHHGHHHGVRGNNGAPPHGSPMLYVSPAPVSSFETHLGLPGLQALFRRQSSVLRSHVQMPSTTTAGTTPTTTGTPRSRYYSYFGDDNDQFVPVTDVRQW